MPLASGFDIMPIACSKGRWETSLIAKCKAEIPSRDTISELQIDANGSTDPYLIKVGKTYLILGIGLAKGPSPLGKEGAFYYTEGGFLLAAPISMFDVIDPRVSATWIIGRTQMNATSLEPVSFFADYYGEKLGDGDPEIVADFARVYAELQRESGRSILLDRFLEEAGDDAARHLMLDALRIRSWSTREVYSFKAFSIYLNYVEERATIVDNQDAGPAAICHLNFEELETELLSS